MVLNFRSLARMPVVLIAMPLVLLLLTGCELGITMELSTPVAAPALAQSTPHLELIPTKSQREQAVDPAHEPTEISTRRAATPEPTTAPTDEPTPAILGMIGPDDFPENVNPLTGLEVGYPELLNRRPLAIKLSNSARVRPQAGLNSADIVFEHLTEGGITRFTALFYSEDADRVGSIRSGRLIDLEIPIMYDAAFAYSGSSIELHWMFARSTFFDRVVSTGFAHGGFERISDPNNPNQLFEDTLFTNTFILHRILEERGQDNPPALANGMAFHPDPPEGGVEIDSVEISYPATSAYWSYYPGLGGYRRWSDGFPHSDANSGQQLFFQNIVILEAAHLNTEIIEDSGGSPSIQIQIWGEGPARLYRDGRRYDGIWRRLDSRHMLAFHTEGGELLPLAPGKTFFQVVPLEYERIYETP